MIKSRSWKPLAIKTIIISSVVLALAALVLVFTVSATSVNSGIDTSQVDTDGKVVVLFPAQSEPLYLVVYEESSPDVYTEKSVQPVDDPSTGEQEYTAIDFSVTHGGESVVLYFAVVPQEDYDDYSDSTIQKDTRPAGENIEVFWTKSDSTEGSFVLAKETITRPIDVRNVTAINTTVGAANPYTVKEGDEVTVTVESNSADAVITAASLEGEALVFSKSSTADAAGYYTYTAVVTFPSTSLSRNEAAKAVFSFTIDGVAIDQDSELVNEGAPTGTVLTQYAALEETDLTAAVTVETLMEDGYITAGPDDVITLTFGGIDRDFEFTVFKLKIGTRTLTSSEYSEDGSSVSFSLNGTEGLLAGDDLSGITVSILDEVGDEYTLTLEGADGFTYYPPLPNNYKLNITGWEEKVTGPPAFLSAFANSVITYQLKANDVYANAEYALVLAVNGVQHSTVPLLLEVDDLGVPTGSPRTGYTYSADVRVGELADISQDDDITVLKITRKGASSTAPITFTYNSALSSITKVRFFEGLQFTSIEYEVMQSTYSNLLAAQNDVVYAVQEDIVRFELGLTHKIRNNPTLTIAGMNGSAVTSTVFNGFLTDLTTFPDSQDFVFYVDAAGKTIRGLFLMPNLNTVTYQPERALQIVLDAKYAALASTDVTIETGESSDRTSDADPVHCLVFWDPIEPSLFSLTMSSNTSLEDDCITMGDQVRLQYTGINADKLNLIEAGARSVTPNGNASFPSGNTRFNLSSENTEGYISGDAITIALIVENASGKTYRIDMPAVSAFTFMTRSSTPRDELSITFADVLPLFTDTTPSHYAVSDYSKLTFEFSTNEIYPRAYTVKLTTVGGVDIEVPLTLVTDPKGSPATGYNYTGSLDMSSVSGLKDFEVIGISMTCDSSPLSYTDNLAGAELKYYGSFTMLSMDVSYPKGNGELTWEPTDEYAYIVDGDFIKITMVFNHSMMPGDLTTIMMDNVTGVESDKTTIDEFVNRPYGFKYDMQMHYYFDATNLPNDTVVCIYRVPKLSDEFYDMFRLTFQRENNDVYERADNVPMSIKVKTTRRHVPSEPATVNTGDYTAKQDAQGKELFHQMLYWAPIDIWNPDITLLNLSPDASLPIDDLDADTYVIVRDGQEIRITFSTKHQILVDEIVTKFSASGTSSSEAPEIALMYSENQHSQSLFVYTATFRIGDAPITNIADQTIIKLIWNLLDARGQKSNNSVKYSQDTRWAIYYKPLEITEVTITTSNRKDETQFCKDEDTITVSYMANHFVMMDGHTIIGRPGEYVESRRRHREPVEYSFTYEVQNGNLKDLAFVKFAFHVADLAGDTFEFSDETAGVINRIKYYAPIEVTAEIASSNARPEFAKNGDTVTISTTTSHEAQTLDFRLGSREVGDNETYREDPTVSYRIPNGEEDMYEGDLFFSVRIEDPAGNYELVSETAEEGEEGTKVTYDRTPPEIKILPGFNGFTNQDVGFTFMYNDMHLDLATVSCVLNDKERIHSAGTNTSYSHTVKLTEEGEYVISATAIDMAGNEMEFAAVCNLIIDKTGPVIKMQLGRNTFKAGFTLDRITDIIEDNLGDMVCTITDNAGVHDWSLELPIDEEGKKTVYTMLRDMAGNTSTPITYDIFIDATAPQPLITNAATSEQFTADGRNFFVGSSARMAISLAPIFMGDEGPDKFTALQLVDTDGNVVFDFLADPVEDHSFTYKFADFGNYTLLAAAKDDVGNETGPMLYMIEFREQYLLERLLENTPLAGLAFIRYISDPLFYAICAAFVLLVAGIVFLIIWRRRKKKQYMAQEYVIVDDE